MGDIQEKCTTVIIINISLGPHSAKVAELHFNAHVDTQRHRKGREGLQGLVLLLL